MTLAQIKALFKTGAIPTQNDFESLIDKIPNNEGGGDKTINVESPNKPFIQGIRTIVDRNEGYTYVALLGLYDEAMQGSFDGAYRYPSIVLRFQCESGSVPPDGTIVQYAFGQYDDFDWDVNVVDDTARLSLEGLDWKTINFSHEVIKRVCLIILKVIIKLIYLKQKYLMIQIIIIIYLIRLLKLEFLVAMIWLLIVTFIKSQRMLLLKI